MTDAQFAILVGLLTEIRDALTLVEVDLGDDCPHPDESRVSFATPGHPDHWICSLCKFEHGVTPN